MKTERLWAPWRIGYIQNKKKEKGCLFCRTYKSKNDTKNLVVARTRHSLALLNLYPYNNGHLMVAPVKHTGSLEFLNEAQTADLMRLVKKFKLVLDRTLKPDGYNIGLNVGRNAGAGIDKHLHIHIVPRWQGDTNFMPALAGTKIISQSLETLYAELIKHSR
jgi:ATP adenylyltransferase